VQHGLEHDCFWSQRFLTKGHEEEEEEEKKENGKEEEEDMVYSCMPCIS